MPSTRVYGEDALTCVITLEGVCGFDLETVPGREVARTKLVEAATRQVDAWLGSLEVVPGRRPVA